MRKYFALILGSLFLILCGISGLAQADVYRVIVKDEQGNPVSGVSVQFCSDTECRLGKTDQDGQVTYEVEAGTYTVHMLKAPEGYLADDTEYQAPETPGDVEIMLRRAPEAKVVDLPACGVEFTEPDLFGNIRGNISYSEMGEMDLGSGIVVGYPMYLGRSMEDIEEINAVLAEKEELDDETMAKLQSFYTDTVYMELFYIVGLSDDKTVEMLFGEESMAFFSSVSEIGTAGEFTFYLLMFDPDYVIANAIPENAPEAYVTEYRNLITQAPEVFLSNIRVREPEKEELTKPGEQISFVTTDLDGNETTSEEIFGSCKVTMINLWATWCGPCKDELAALGEMNGIFNEQDCQIIGICIDADGEQKSETAKQLLADNGVTYANYRPYQALNDQLQFTAIPTSYFVDSEGRILTEPVVGARLDAYPVVLQEALSLVENAQ